MAQPQRFLASFCLCIFRVSNPTTSACYELDVMTKTVQAGNAALVESKAVLVESKAHPYT